MSMKFTSKNTLKRIFDRLKLIFIKKSDVINNLTSTDTDKPLAAYQGKVLSENINTLNSNKATRGIATGTTGVLHRAYNSAGISTNGIKTIMIATDSDSMNYAVFLVDYVHGIRVNLVKLLDGGIDKSAYNNVGTISWTGNTGTVTVVVIPVQ